MPGCQKDEGDRGGFLKAQTIRNRQDILRWDSCILRVASLGFIADNLVGFAQTVPTCRAVFASSITYAGRDQNLVVRFVILDQISNSRNFTRNVASRNVGQWNPF